MISSHAMNILEIASLHIITLTQIVVNVMSNVTYVTATMRAVIKLISRKENNNGT